MVNLKTWRFTYKNGEKYFYDKRLEFLDFSNLITYQYTPKQNFYPLNYFFT